MKEEELQHVYRNKSLHVHALYSIVKIFVSAILTIFSVRIQFANISILIYLMKCLENEEKIHFPAKVVNYSQFKGSGLKEGQILVFI